MWQPRLVAVMALLCASFLAADSVAVTRPHLDLGEPLVEALAAYRALGLNIVSTTGAVNVRHRLTRLPPYDLPPVAQVRIILQPHGLGLQNISDDTWVVTKNSSAEKVPGQPAADSTSAATAVADVTPLVDEIVVTGSYRLAQFDEAASVLVADDLSTLPVIGGDILRAMAVLPGLASSGVSAAARVRGGDLDEVQYLLEDVPLLAPFHLSEFHSPFSTLNGNVISAVEVFTSGFPVRYGGKMSGVVALDLIEPDSELMGGVDINTISASMYAAGTRGRWSWITSLRRSTIDYLFGLLERDYGRPRFHDELLHGRYAGERTNVEVGLFNTADKVDLSDPSADETGSTRLNYTALWLKVDRAFSDALLMQFRVSALDADDRTRGTLDDDDDVTGALFKERSYSVVQLANDWIWQMGALDQLTLGWRAQRQKLDSEFDLNAEYGPLAFPISGRTEQLTELQAQRTGQLVSAFATWEHSWQQLDLRLGVRYSYQDIDPVHEARVDPRLRLLWHLNDHHRLLFDVGSYVQHQDLYDLQLDDGLIELQRPQRSNQVSLSWQYEAKLAWQASVYYRNVQKPWTRFDNLYNRWVLLPELHADRVRFDVTKTRNQGVELAVGSRDDATWQWQASYSLAQTQEHVFGRWHDRPWDQRQTGKARIQYSGERWKFGLSAVYRSGWPTTELVRSSARLISAVDSKRLPRFFSVDVHLARTFRLAGMQGEAYLGLSNATNRRNVGGYDYDVQDDLPDAGDLSAATREPSRLLPAVPTLGVKLTW